MGIIWGSRFPVILTHPAPFWHLAYLEGVLVKRAGLKAALSRISSSLWYFLFSSWWLVDF